MYEAGNAAGEACDGKCEERGTLLFQPLPSSLWLQECMATQARTDLLSTISRSMTSGGTWVHDKLQSDVQATVTKRPQQLGRGLFKEEANGASQTDWAAHVAALPSVSEL